MAFLLIFKTWTSEVLKHHHLEKNEQTLQASGDIAALCWRIEGFT